MEGRNGEIGHQVNDDEKDYAQPSCDCCDNE